MINDKPWAYYFEALSLMRDSYIEDICEQLPDSCLFIIFRFLPQQDRVRAAAVAKLWMEKTTQAGYTTSSLPPRGSKIAELRQKARAIQHQKQQRMQRIMQKQQEKEARRQRQHKKKSSFAVTAGDAESAQTDDPSMFDKFVGDIIHPDETSKAPDGLNPREADEDEKKVEDQKASEPEENEVEEEKEVEVPAQRAAMRRSNIQKYFLLHGDRGTEAIAGRTSGGNLTSLHRLANERLPLIPIGNGAFSSVRSATDRGPHSGSSITARNKQDNAMQKIWVGLGLD